MNLRHGAISVFASVSSLLLLVLPIAKAQQLQSSGSNSQKSAASEQAATMQPTPRITQAIDDSSVVRIPRTTHPLATPANDRGRTDADLPMNRIVLVLKPSALQQAALTKLHRQPARSGVSKFSALAHPRAICRPVCTGTK